MQRLFMRQARIRVPIVCGAMYPCSNPALVAAVSRAGGIGVVQPLALQYVHGERDLRNALRRIAREAGRRPIGMNALIEQSSQKYRKRMEHCVDVALEEGVRFFVTSLGNPRWVVDRVRRAEGGVVYHDVTNDRWALKGLEAGVHGLVAVNNRAGGHAGLLDARDLLDRLVRFEVPVLCAGGVGNEYQYVEALRMGYAGVQMGTRFIATTECSASEAYKHAIMTASEDDVVLSELLTGVPVSVLRTHNDMQTQVHPIARYMLQRGGRAKHWARAFYAMRGACKVGHDQFAAEARSTQWWQAGKSVQTIERVEPVEDIVRRFINVEMTAADAHPSDHCIKCIR